MNQIDEIAAEKAANSRKEMREKMRKQKRDIEEAKSKQPSLIERYEQVPTPSSFRLSSKGQKNFLPVHQYFYQSILF